MKRSDIHDVGRISDAGVPSILASHFPGNRVFATSNAPSALASELAENQTLQADRLRQ